MAAYETQDENLLQSCTDCVDIAPTLDQGLRLALKFEDHFLCSSASQDNPQLIRESHPNFDKSVCLFEILPGEQDYEMILLNSFPGKKLNTTFNTFFVRFHLTGCCHCFLFDIQIGFTTIQWKTTGLVKDSLINWTLMEMRLLVCPTIYNSFRLQDLLYM